MHEDRSCTCQSGSDTRPLTTDEKDTRTEREILRLILKVFPELYTENDLIQEVASDPDEFGPRDDVLRAIRDLDKIGLLNVSGPLVVPSRAALRFDLLGNV